MRKTPEFYLQRIKEFESDIKLNRADLASLLSVSWPRIQQLLPNFDTLQQDGEVLIRLSSVTRFYEMKISTLACKTGGLTARANQSKRLRSVLRKDTPNGSPKSPARWLKLKHALDSMTKS